MSIEQLLNPRVKLAIKYPGQPVPTGTILHKYETGGQVYYVDTPGTLLTNGCVFAEIVDEHLHLFKRLHWSEEREKEDLTGYIKLYINDEWRVFEMNILDDNLMQWKFGGRNRKEFLPATEIEYLTYINSKK